MEENILLTKRCTKCGVEKPLTGFHKNKTTKDGLQLWCKVCQHNHAIDKDKVVIRRKNYDCEYGMKVCHKCGITKPLDQFNNDSRAKSGKVTQCKSCQKIYSSKYNKEHPEVGLNYQRKYRSENKEKVDANRKRYIEATKEEREAVSKKYREDNRDRLLEESRKRYLENHDQQLERSRAYSKLHKKEIDERGKKYREENKEIISKTQKKYNSTPKGKVAKVKRKHIRRAREENSKFTLTPRQWVKVLDMQNNICNICGRSFDDNLKPTADHIIPISSPLCPGLTFGNTQALCHSCNSSKGNRFSFGKSIDNILVNI